MEDDLKILKVEYLRNRWLDLRHILNLCSGDQTKIKNTLNEVDRKWKTTTKYQKLNISATTDWVFLKFQTYTQGTKPK
jgi:spore cortex formation protein SpoVR/YcgB (stage V sporulation)